MTIAPVDFIAVANDISNIGNEAAFRSCVSRAYYGAFNECSDVAKIKLSHTNHMIFSDSSHENLLKQMESEPHLSGWRSIAYVMRALKIERVESDYRMDATVIQSDAVNAIATAKEVVNRLHKIP